MSALSGGSTDQQVRNAMPDTDATRISVVVVDDHELVAESLASALREEPGIVVSGVASTMASALELVERTRPQVVVVDYRLAREHGIEAARRIRQAVPGSSVVLLSAVATGEVLSRAVAAGCTGAVTKDVSVGNLSSVVRAAARGERAVAGDFEGHIRSLSGGGKAMRRSLLTAREQEILRAISHGETTPAIARSLGLSEYTVRNHVRNILGKLGAHTKLEAVIHAARAGILSLEDS